MATDERKAQEEEEDTTIKSTRLWMCPTPGKRAWLEVFQLPVTVAALVDAMYRAIATGAMDIPPHPPLMIHGKACTPKRCTAFFSDVSAGYAYSRITMPSRPLTPELKILMGWVSTWLSARVGHEVVVNGILVQKYGDEGAIADHRDDESGLLPGDAGVFAISAGAAKPFKVTTWDAAGKRVVAADHRTGHAEALWMGGADFQKVCVHGVRKLKACAGTRVSWTFRCHTK